MSNISGQVEAKAGKGTGILIAGTWYNGSVEQLINVEKYDTVTVEHNNQRIISVEKISGGSSESASKPAYSSSNKGGGGFKKSPAKSDWNDPKRQEVIVFQSARNAAIETLKTLLDPEVGAVKLPAKQSDKFDTAMSLINLITKRYHEDAMALYTGTPVDEIFEKENNE